MAPYVFCGVRITSRMLSDGQSHVSVVDKNGMVVSLTSTVNVAFGSQVLDPETGILLNDEVRTTYGARRGSLLKLFYVDGRFLHARDSEQVRPAAIPVYVTLLQTSHFQGVTHR